MDRNCQGKAQYNIKTNQLQITKEFTITKFEEHNYIKEKNIYEKIEYNQITEEEMNNLIYQKQYLISKNVILL